MITNEDNFILSRIVETGNFFRFQGQEWDNQIKCFARLTDGSPQKCQKMLELLAEVNPLEDRISSTINPSNIESAQIIDTISNYYIGGEDFSASYVDTYGPKDTTIVGGSKKHYEGWTRISDNKYKCDRVEVVDHFRQLLTPGLSNAGTYMTYKYVTVEINEDDDRG